MSKRKVVGIDLGETYSSIAHVNEYGEPEVILNAENESRTPSVIMFDDDTDRRWDDSKASGKNCAGEDC